MDVKSKGLLRKMFDAAVAELARRAAGADAPEARAWHPPSPDSEQSARTVGASQVRFDHHKDVVAESAPVPAPAPPAASEPAAVVPAAASPHSAVVFVHGDAGDLRVRWRVEPEHVVRASAVLGEPHVPCLRLISFSATSSSVVREVQDRPNAAAHGECDVRDVPDRLIASYGLRAGDKFVSVAHAVL